MEKDFKNLYFELKEQADALKSRLEKAEEELHNLQKKYLNLLEKKEKTAEAGIDIFNFNHKKNKLLINLAKSQKKEPRKIPVRFMVVLILLAAVAVYVFGAVKDSDAGFYTEITKGVVFPKRTIASIADIFYHKLGND
jgi:hypothetical protein